MSFSNYWNLFIIHIIIDDGIHDRPHGPELQLRQPSLVKTTLMFFQ